jgi:hypothetical protein
MCPCSTVTDLGRRRCKRARLFGGMGGGNVAGSWEEAEFPRSGVLPPQPLAFAGNGFHI